MAQPNPPMAQPLSYASHPSQDAMRPDQFHRGADPRVANQVASPAAYDLGNYGLPTPPPAHPQHPQAPVTGRDGRTQPPRAPAQQVDPYGYPHPPSQPQAPAAQAGGYPGGYGHPHQQVAGGQHPPEEADQYDDEMEYEEPPRRSRRWLIALALVGSIGVGSGIAYAYKIFVGPSGDKTQIVRRPSEPAKVAPIDRGGKQFANTDSQVLNGRSPEQGSFASPGGESSQGYTDSNGVRRVSTVAVGPGATPISPGPSSVPGMTIVGSEPAPVSPPPAMNTAPSAPAVINAPPRTRPAPPPAEAAEPSPPPALRTAAAKATVTEQPRPRPVGGYVAVLGFQRSQLDAMKMMADLQQKYDVLRDKRLEIVQSDQTSRGLGVIYRVVVGPRMGIGPVRDVCNQLLEAGMPKQGCYPLAE